MSNAAAKVSSVVWLTCLSLVCPTSDKCFFFQNQANKEDQFKSKVDERNRKAELVRQNKLKVEESGDLVPESA